MKKLHLCFLLVASSLFVWGCGDDSASNANNENGGSNLPPQQGTEIPCDAGNEGLEIKPADSENPRLCTNGTWVEILSSSSSIKTPEPAEGSSSSSVKAPELAEGSSSSSVKAPELAEGSSSSSFKTPELAEGSSSSSIKAPELAEGSSSSSVKTPEPTEGSSSSTPIEDLSSSSEESKMYLCDDGITYVLDLANCANSSSSSVIQSSSSTKKPEESSSSTPILSSSSTLISSSSSTPIEDPNSSSSSVVSSSSSAVSSSSVQSSSSSVMASSSSSFEITGICKTEFEDNCTYGSLYDERDGQTYKTVKIGEQWWMAENLRYEDAEQSVCYTDNPDNCLIYGKLYTRKGALNDCPNGWHLPTEKEWLKLREYAKGTIDKNNVGQYLRADTLWDVSGLGVGYDAFGFSALPAGVKDHDGWWGLNTHTHFWLSDSWKNGSDNCYVYVLIRYKLKDDSDMKIGKNGNICDLYPSSKYSVRCIKD